MIFSVPYSFVCNVPYQNLSSPSPVLQHRRVPDGSSENDFYKTSIEDAEKVITLSQVDQTLCDQAEVGRIHGRGSFRNGCWVSGDGQYYINLNLEWRYCGGPVPYTWDCIAHITGQPCITSSGWCPSYLNQTEAWNTQWLYLRMSAGEIPSLNVPRLFGGVTQYELDISVVLCKKFGLSGCWGGVNRVTADPRWKEDKSLLNTPVDSGWKRLVVSNSRNEPVHNVKVKLQDETDTAIVLPETILRRPEFDARRVFWLSEEIHYPIKFGRFASGTINVTLSYPRDLTSDDGWLIYPGGANAVGIADLTLLRNARKVNLLLVAKQGLEGWKFTMLFAVRLRRENVHTFSIKFLNGTSMKILSLKQFRKELQIRELSVPEELSDGFRGSLNTFITHNHTELIPGVLDRGAALLVSGSRSSEVAFYLATSIKRGCWDGRWRPAKRGCKVTLLIDKHLLLKLEKTTLPTGVDVRAGNLSLADTIETVKGSKLVVLASEYLENDKIRYRELLMFCLEHDIAIIVFTEQPDQFVLSIASRCYTLSCQRSEMGNEYLFGSSEMQFGVKFMLSRQGQLASCNALSKDDLLSCFSQNEAPVDNGLANFKMEFNANTISHTVFS